MLKNSHQSDLHFMRDTLELAKAAGARAMSHLVHY